jgi:phosphoribosylanthranilate isomerase
MTWIKICGITNLEDALTAVDAGANALGFVFYEKSPRNISPAQAREIIGKMSRSVEKVGLFVNQDEDTICAVAEQVGLTAVQMHGDNEDPHVADLVAERGKVKVFAAIAMNGPNPAGWAMTWRPHVISAFLLDSGGPSLNGGTGKTFDWRASTGAIKVIKRLGKLVLAGGLTPENVGEGIRAMHPWGVDVSSGVEMKPGKKDPGKIRAFINAVREADKTNSRN